jgi:FKBP-type peptidyl-prolyl cis-trans isomerase FkpA
LRRLLVAAALAVIFPAAALAQAGAEPTKPAAEAGKKAAAAPPAKSPKTDPQAFRAVGLSIAQQLKVFELSPAELDQVLKAIRDGVAGKAAFEPAAMQPRIQALFQARTAQAAEKEKGRSAGAVEAAAKEKGAEKTASGLVYVPLREGTGASPVATDKVKVNYRGTLVDGKEFDSSYARGQPVEFPLNGVIPCWTEGLQKMKVGGKAKLVCPPGLAYGDRGAPGGAIPPGATLVFEVELLDIAK